MKKINKLFFLFIPFLGACQMNSYKLLSPHQLIIQKSNPKSSIESSRVWIHPAYTNNNNSRGDFLSLPESSLKSEIKK